MPQSPKIEAMDNGNNTRDKSGVKSMPAAAARNKALASGPSSRAASGQQFAKGDTRACPPVYDRANYEDTMSVFGRAVRDALKGQCIENIRLSRVLVVHLYSFILRECAPFEHPRRSVAQEEEEAEEGRAAGGGGKQDAVARKIREAAERKAKKEAEKAEAKRRAKLGAKAAAEELRKAKEAASLRAIEEEKRRRTQVGTGLDLPSGSSDDRDCCG